MANGEHAIPSYSGKFKLLETDASKVGVPVSDSTRGDAGIKERGIVLREDLLSGEVEQYTPLPQVCKTMIWFDKLLLDEGFSSCPGSFSS